MMLVDESRANKEILAQISRGTIYVLDHGGVEV